MYHAVTAYHLIEVILHSILNNNHQSIILIADVLEKKINIDELRKNFSFKVIIYNFGEGNKLVEDYFEYIFRQHNIDLKDIEEIYVPCAHHGFGIFLCRNNIPFVFFEDASGAVSRHLGLETIEKKYIPKHELAVKYGLYEGIGNNITSRICDKSAQLNDYCLDDVIDFCVVKELSKLDEDNQKNIIKIFCNNINNIYSDKNSVLILTEHLSNLGVLSWNEQIFMYQTLVDYFFKDKKIIIKPHPDDITYYDNIFGGCNIIRERFPAELLPFIFNKQSMPSTVATISSTSINTIRCKFSEIIEFNQEYSYHKKQFNLLHKYFIALSAISNFINQKEKLYLYGVNEKIISNILKTLNVHNVQLYDIDDVDMLSSLDNEIVIIDSLNNWYSVSERICSVLKDDLFTNMVIFINSDSNYYFYSINNKITLNIDVIEIRKSTKNNNYIYGDLCSEYIFLYCKKGEKFNMDKIKYSLPYTGIEIESELLGDDKRKIKILEAMLAASEKRLLYYIEKENNKE